MAVKKVCLSRTPARYNMNFKSQYLLNQYGQDLVSAGAVLSYFEGLNDAEKNTFFYLLLHLIVQSGCTQEDVPLAIAENGLKPSYTPCVLLANSVKTFNLEKIINLPAYEHPKVLLLFLGLFKQGYTRRFEAEKNVSHKWWYWDFRDPDKVEDLKALFPEAFQQV